MNTDHLTDTQRRIVDRVFARPRGVTAWLIIEGADGTAEDKAAVAETIQPGAGRQFVR